MKKIALLFVVLGLLSSNIYAQQGASNKEKIAAIVKGLGELVQLSDDQKSKIQELGEAVLAKHQQLKNGEEDEEFIAFKKQSNEKLMNVLNADQIEVFKTKKKEIQVLLRKQGIIQQ